MPGRDEKGNHVFIVTKAIRLEDLDKRYGKILLGLFCRIESNWNFSIKRGFYKFILCCLPEQQERVLKMLWEADVSYEFLASDDVE